MQVRTHIGFILFLLVYAYIKYMAVPSLMGSFQYMLTTALVVLLTAVIPYFASYILTRKGALIRRYTLAAFLPLVLSVAGLAVYFYLFIAPNAPAMSVTQVLPRAVIPGLTMGVILLIPIFLHRKRS